MLLFTTALALAMQAQVKGGPTTTEKPAPPPVDRTAEPTLKALFAQSGSLKGVHIVVQIYPREVAADRYNDDSSIDLWLGEGGRFRYQSSGNYWGGGSLYISDGLALLRDEMSDDSSITISNPAKTMHELNEQEPLLYFLEGETGFDAFVEKDKALKFLSKPTDKDQVIEVNTKKLGRVVLRYEPGSSVPAEIGLYQAPWWQDQKEAADKPYTRETITIVSKGPIDSALFRVTAPKGRTVVDQRKK